MKYISSKEASEKWKISDCRFRVPSPFRSLFSPVFCEKSNHQYIHRLLNLYDALVQYRHG